MVDLGQQTIEFNGLDVEVVAADGVRLLPNHRSSRGR